VSLEANIPAEFERALPEYGKKRRAPCSRAIDYFGRVDVPDVPALVVPGRPGVVPARRRASAGTREQLIAMLQARVPAHSRVKRKTAGTGAASQIALETSAVSRPDRRARSLTAPSDCPQNSVLPGSFPKAVFSAQR